MAKTKTIKSIVMGYKGELDYLFVDTKGKRLAILLPGVGYNNDMPLLYYSSKVLNSKGYSILKVNYRYKDNEEFNNASFKEIRKWIRADVIASTETLFKENEFEEIVLVCKSVGTIAGIESLKTIKELRTAKIIWQTPLIHMDEIVNDLNEIENESLILIGTNDQCYVKENIDLLGAKKNYKNIIIPDADHRLEVSGDIQQSIKIIETITKEISNFIDTGR